MRHDAIEAYVIKNFGEKALVPVGDVDRPFTPAELKKLAEEKYVHIGNHTSDHAILTNCTPDELNTQIRGAQNMIYDMTGIIPEAISYPSGHCSMEVLTSAKEIGLKLGFTISRRKNYLPVDMTSGNMCLSRFSLDGYTGLIKQFEIARSDHRRLKHRFVDFLRSYAVGMENSR
jgi:peptidoglycan/xylan/chitin deacetylase (PgdA/CDA1 family)